VARSPLVRGASTALAGRLGNGDALGRGRVTELAHGLDVLLDVAGLPPGVDIAHVGYVAFVGGCDGVVMKPQPEMSRRRSRRPVRRGREELLDVPLEQPA
jgi:hypothetical protein